MGDEGLGLRGGVDEGGDEADVFGYVGEVVGREGEDGEAGLEDGGEGLHAIGDAGDDEVGFGGEERVEVAGCVEGPAVVEDGEVAGGEFREEFEAVFGDGAEGVEAAEGLEGDGDGGLERGYAHGCLSGYSYSTSCFAL